MTTMLEIVTHSSNDAITSITSLNSSTLNPQIDVLSQKFSM